MLPPGTVWESVWYVLVETMVTLGNKCLTWRIAGRSSLNVFLFIAYMLQVMMPY